MITSIAMNWWSQRLFVTFGISLCISSHGKTHLNGAIWRRSCFDVKQ
jgi:hypothetical protein